MGPTSHQTSTCTERPMTDQTRDDIRRRYASAATRTATNHTAVANDDRFGLAQYDHATELPEAARLASLGCGNP